MKKVIFLFLLSTVVVSCKATKQKISTKNSFDYEVIRTMDREMAKLQGKILIVPDGNGIPNATLQLFSGQNQFSAESQVNGNFFFVNVPPGNYQIRTDYPGFYSFRDSIKVTSGQIISMTVGLGYDE